MDLLRFMTAGNVDDGKSTLVGRLFYEYGKIPKDLWKSIEESSRKRGGTSPNFAFLTDGLTEEREKGITIDSAFRYFSTERRKFILADSPGHLEYLPNMVTAATQAEAAVILVDATRGVSIQTIRHAWIAQWLGIHEIFFAINKIDAIDFDEKKYRKIESEISERLSRSSFKSRAVIAPVSALLGDNLIRRSDRTPWYSGVTLDEWLHSILPQRLESLNAPVRFSIQIKRENDGKNEFLGSITSGILHRGDFVSSPRLKQGFRVEKISSFDRDLESVMAGMPIRLSLESDQSDALERGDTLCSDEKNIPGSETWEVEFCAFYETTTSTDRFFGMTATDETEVLSFTVHEIFNPERQVWEKSTSTHLAAASLGRATLQFQKKIYSDPYGDLPQSGRMILVHRDNHRTAAVVLLKKPL